MRGIKLTAAILSIILGALFTFSGLVLAWMSSLLNMYVGLVGFANTWLTITGYLYLGFGIAMIVLGSLYCTRKKRTGVGIALLALNAILIILTIVEGVVGGTFGILTIISMIIPIIITVFIIVYLCCAKNKQVTTSAPAAS